MKLPPRVAGLTWLTAVAALYLFVWIAWEGVVWQTILAATLTTAVWLLHMAQKYGAGRLFGLGSWLLLTAVAGLVAGLTIPLLTLFLMALKTGLHAHGPEFTAAEIEWVLSHIPLWTAVGLLAGLGGGLLSWGLGQPTAVDPL